MSTEAKALLSCRTDIRSASLTAIAGGTTATSSVTYTSPVLDVALPSGQHVTLSDPGGSVSFGASIDAGSLLDALHPKAVQVQVRLSLGELTKSVTATSVSGSVSTLRVQLSVGGSVGADVSANMDASTTVHTILDLGIGELSEAATAPTNSGATPGCGYGCGTSPCTGYGSAACAPSSTPSQPAPPSPSSSPSHGGTTPGSSKSPAPGTYVAGTTSGNLPLTGSNTPLYVGGGVILLLIGRFLMAMARRREAL